MNRKVSISRSNERYSPTGCLNPRNHVLFCLALTTLAGLINFVDPVLADTVIAEQITASNQLLNGPYADGQIGDYLLQNDRIAVVISNIGHAQYNALSGGNIIDAGSATIRSDALGNLYTYFNDDWPRQAVYTSLEIVNDGSGGGPAVIRVSGVDSDNANLEVETDYSLAVDDDNVVLVSTVTKTNGGPLNNFELGDAFYWGACNNFAPGYGFDLPGTSSEPWLAGTSDAVSYGFAGAHGDLWGINGNYWSDVNVVSRNIPGGGSVSYSRYFVIGDGQIAGIAGVIHDLLDTPVGSASGTVLDADTLEPLAGATVHAFDSAGNIYLTMATDGSGHTACTVPPDTWRLVAAQPNYENAETLVTVTAGGTSDYQLLLPPLSTEIPAIGDTLTVIQRPLMNVPAIITPGDTLLIECAADPATSGWQAALRFADIEIPLQLAAAEFDPASTWWRLSALIPQVGLYELYDLQVTADTGPETPLLDVTRNAVRVIPEFREDFYFVQITDTHLPTHLYNYEGGADTDSSEVDDLRAVLADLAIINPEFILLTGDMLNEGELEDYLYRRVYTKAQRLLSESTVPVYLVAGNHDIGGWNDTPPSAGTARRDWWRFFGWQRLADPPPAVPWRTQNYSFAYGPVFFVGLEAYDNYDSWRYEYYSDASFTAPQLDWLDDQLATGAQHDATVLFYHFDFHQDLNLSSLGVDLALWGHIHRDEGNINSHPCDLATNNCCDGERSFRLVRYRDGQLQPRPTLSAGPTGNSLTVSYSPANDGSQMAVTATISNAYNEDFANARLVFELLPSAGTVEVSGGTLLQTRRTGEATTCYVEVDLSASTTQSVSVALETSPVDEPRDLPVAPSLAQNHPNPFNPATKLGFNLPDESHVDLAIFDLRGNEIISLVNQTLAAGDHHVQWNGRDQRGDQVAAGAYIARMVVGGEVSSRKIMLAK